MSQPAVAALEPLPFELVFEDGEPLDNLFHVIQIDLLRDLIRQAMAEQGRTEFFTGGNNFVYYSREQARDVYQGKPYYRGPDVYFVDGADPRRKRKGWVAWEEGGRLPDVIVELQSPSTARIDRTVKRELYQNQLRTPEYFLYDPSRRLLEGLRLGRRGYRQIPADAGGRLWSERLQASLGLWHGIQEDQDDDWVRLFDAQGRMIPSKQERAEAAEGRAETAEERAEAAEGRADEAEERAEAAEERAAAAEAELLRLRTLLARQGQE